MEVLATRNEFVEGADQVATHGAAHAAVVHGHDVFLGFDLLHDQTFVDVHLQEKRRTRNNQSMSNSYLLHGGKIRGP